MCSDLNKILGIHILVMNEYQAKAVPYTISSFAPGVKSVPSFGAKSLVKNLMDNELGPFDQHKQSSFRSHNHLNRSFRQVKTSL